MYIRDQGNQKPSARIKPPENYSGSAFRQGEMRLPAELPLPPGLLSDTPRGEPVTELRQPCQSADTRPPVQKQSLSPLSGGEATPDDKPDCPPGGDPPAPPSQDNDDISACEAGCSDCCAPERISKSKSDCKSEKRESRGALSGLLSSIMPPGLGSSGEREFGFEELLILGLILLLSQSSGDKPDSGADNGILLILALLLFCR